MLHGLGKLLVLLGKLLLLPIELFIWLEEAITGERRWLEQQRRSIQERGPLPDEGFLEAAGVSAEDVPTALATRRAVAEACGIPANALSPADALATLRCLMAPGPDAHWADLGPDWFEVILHVGEFLGIKKEKVKRKRCQEPFFTCFIKKGTSEKVPDTFSTF